MAASAGLDSLMGGWLYACVYVCVVCSWLYQRGFSTVIGLSLIDSWQAALGIGNSSVTLSPLTFSFALALPLCFGYQLFVGVCVMLQKLDPVLPQHFSSQQQLLL